MQLSCKPCSVRYACIMHWFVRKCPLHQSQKFKAFKMCLLYFIQLTKSTKSCCNQYKNSPFDVTPVAARVTRGKQPIAYFTQVERKQIQWVRIELKSPIQSWIPPFTPREMKVGKCDNKLKEWPLVSVCMCGCAQTVYRINTCVLTNRQQAQEWIFTVQWHVHWSRRASSVADLQQSR